MSQPKKKVILKLQLHDKETKKNAVKTVRGLPGILEFYEDMKNEDMKDENWIVIGDIDPVSVVNMLRKFCTADILSVVTVKEPPKKEEEEEEPESSSKKKWEEPKKDDVAKLVRAYQAYNPYTS